MKITKKKYWGRSKQENELLNDELRLPRSCYIHLQLAAVGSQIKCNMYLNCSIPSVTNSSQNPSSGMKLIDLNNYYRNDKECQNIHCQICDCSVLKEEVFEHTVSKRHKYNKLFVAISQDCSKNADLDFIVLSIDRLKCRLCETVITNSNEDDVVVSHIQGVEHMEKKFLNWISAEASQIEYKHLQPLDSLITHHKIYQKRMNKPVSKKSKKISSSKKAEVIEKELRVTSNIEQDVLKYSAFSKNYRRARGEELPKCIIMVDKATCMCTICFIHIARSTHNVGGHIDGKKHKRNILKLTKSTSQKVEVIDSNKKSSPEPVKLLYHSDIKETAKDSNDTHNISRNDIPQCSAFLEGANAQNGKQSLDCIIVGENGTRICTVCVTGIPNTTVNIDEHLSGKKHKANMESKLQKVKKPEPLPVETMCTTCGMKIENTKRARRKHNKCQSPEEKALQIEESTLQKSNLQDPKQSTAASISSTTSSCYVCLICLVMVPNNAHNIEMHDKGMNHQRHMLKSNSFDS